MKYTFVAMLSLGLMLGSLVVPSVSASCGFGGFGWGGFGWGNNVNYCNNAVSIAADGTFAVSNQAVRTGWGGVRSSTNAVAVDPAGNFAAQSTDVRTGGFGPWWF